MSRKKLDVGSIGIAIDDMLEGKKGFIYVDGERYEVYADEDIRAFTKVVVVKEIPHFLIRQVRSGAKGLGYIHDDYKELAFTIAETSYEIGTAAHVADKDVPKFEAQLLKLRTTEGCYIRFNEDDRVRHKLTKDTDYEYQRRCTKLYVVQDSTGGTLTIRAFG